MKPTLLLAFVVLAAGFVSGCGDPAPSTTLAPDQKPLDASKLSKEQVDQMLQKDHAGGSDRSGSAPGGTPAGR